MRVIALALVLVAGCQHQSPGGKPHRDPQEDLPVHPGPDTTTDGSTDSGSPTFGPHLSVPPSARIFGLPRMQLDMDIALIPAHPDEPSVILLAGANDDFEEQGLPATYFIQGDVPPGDHSILDLWDQVSSYDYRVVAPFFEIAGDVDDDGYRDMWFGDELHLGPLLGKQLRFRDDYHAWIENEGGVVAADFDADGDGNEDVLLVQCCQTGVIRYGPFEGHLGSSMQGEVPMSEVSWLGDFSGCVDSYATSLLRNHLGPGRHAAAIGADGGGSCGMDTWVFDVMQPRGTVVRYNQAIASSSFLSARMLFEDAGDLDGDDDPDVVWGDSFYTEIYSAPLSGYVPYLEPSLEQADVLGNVVHAVGDVNGDKIQDLLAVWTRSFEEIEGTTGNPWDRSWTLLFSPFSEPIDPQDGLELGLYEDIGKDLGELHADLDGDGLSDLIGTGRFDGVGATGPDAPGEIKIWYATDLLRAWEEQQALRSR